VYSGAWELSLGFEILRAGLTLSSGEKEAGLRVCGIGSKVTSVCGEVGKFAGRPSAVAHTCNPSNLEEIWRIAILGQARQKMRPHLNRKS
jgi:hypothetical protein